MATKHPVPKDREVKQMLGMLYGKGLGVDAGEPVATGAGSNSIVAIYIDDEGLPVTACCCDIPFAAYSGAALSMIPRGGAEDAANSGDLSEMMRGNLNEIMNICSRLFISDKTPHLRLGALYDGADALPEAARSMLDTAPGRADLRISIPGYGEGNVSFLST
jgi:hypothetical protein